jgi:hypothetical protein
MSVFSHFEQPNPLSGGGRPAHHRPSSVIFSILGFQVQQRKICHPRFLDTVGIPSFKHIRFVGPMHN